MQQEIVMPQLGLTMTEGAVSAWMKKPGDRVERGDILFLVQTDKVEMEVESFVSGVLENVLVEPEVVVQVGTVIATVEDGRPAVQKTPLPKTEAAVPTTNATPAVAPQSAAKGKIPVSPRARKMAQSLGIDLDLIKPANGTRILEEDVRLFHEKAPANDSPPAENLSPRLGRTQGRTIVAQRMAESFHSAPHFYLTTQADATKLVEVRTASIEVLQGRTGLKPTYTDFFLRALAQALSEHSTVNSFWNANAVEQRSTVDLSLAVQTGHGLLTPVLKNADRLTFPELMKQRSALVEKANARKLTFQELEGGSATLSNLGTHKVDEFHAILNPPQSVILATGQIAKRPSVVDDRVEARSTVFLTLSADHRVLDGAAAAVFLDRIRELIENPLALLL